jgi:Dynamin central region
MCLPDLFCPSVLTADDLEGMILAARGRILPLPGRAEYDTSEIIIQQVVEQWKALSVSCVNAVGSILRSFIAGNSDSLVYQAAISRFKRLHHELVETFVGLLHERSSLTLDRVIQRWEMEKQLFTTNGETLRSYRYKFTASIQHVIKPDVKESVETFFSNLEATAAAKLANIGLTKDSLSIMQSKLECGDQIIETISNAMAYFQLKADSYIDCACSYVLLYLLRDFAHDLGSELNEGIGVLTKSEDDLYRVISE